MDMYFGSVPVVLSLAAKRRDEICDFADFRLLLSSTPAALTANTRLYHVQIPQYYLHMICCLNAATLSIMYYIYETWLSGIVYDTLTVQVYMRISAKIRH